MRSETGDESGLAARVTSNEPYVRVFGGVAVEQNGPVSVGGPRQRRLLALLAIRVDTALSIDWLAEYLWLDDDRPEEPARAIRTYVSRLRSALPPPAHDWIETVPIGYRFRPPAEAVEHRRFTLLRTEAARARERRDPQTALRLLDEALELWRGEPFPEFDDLDWARATIEQLRLDRLEMIEERWEVSLALGRHTQIIGELAAFTSEHRLRDRATRQYALALHRSGRTAEALSVLDDHRRVLAERSGLDPSPAVAELERALLAGDPSLDIERQGRPLRGYRLIEQAGTGAFSIVWRAIQPSVDREVAVKQIRAELASQPEFIRRFEAEAHLVARLEHPHIVPLIDFWRDPDSAYLVMRWLSGGTLERRLDDGPLTIDATVTLARQIGGALSAAHRHGVIHRDLKAANVLFDDAGHAFLADFGIALEAAETAGPAAELSSGSPAYASPEQLRRERLGPEADIFSLGVVVYECLTASLPFADSRTVEELVDRQLHTEYPSLLTLRGDIPPALADAVARATAKEPAARFASVEDFLDAVEASPGPMTRVARTDDAAVAERENPYRGLRAFDDGDTDRFFGRDRLVTALVDRLRGDTLRSRCVVVVGPSGSGKSSVVRAGLVPALRDGAVAGSADWFTTAMVPGSDPFESLEAALLRVAVNPPSSLMGQLRDGPRGLLRCVRRCLPDDDQRVLLVIDQFEELFTASSDDDTRSFLSALAEAVEDPTSPLRVVVTLRADYYDRPLEHPAFARIIDEASVNVTPLAADELEQAIVEPARRLGVEFEPGLVARIAAETLGQPSPLPLLQYALRELFDRRDGDRLTVGAYDEIGGLTGALTTRAEALYADADRDQRSAVRRVFGRLTSPGEESADLRRRVTISDLGADPAVGWTLEHYGSARLLTFDRHLASREPTVEVAHEALLRQWPRLVAWLGEDADVLRSVESVVSAATVWDEGGRAPSDLARGGRLDTAISLLCDHPERLRPLDVEFVAASRAAAEAERAVEQRRVRRLRRLVGVVAAALVLALVAAGVAVRQRNQAQAASERAELATIISRSAALSEDQPEVSLLLALEGFRREAGPETEQAVLNALGRSPVGNVVTSFGRLAPDGGCDVPSIVAEDGSTEYVTTGDVLLRRDLMTGEVTEHGPPPAPCFLWFGDEAADLQFAFGIEDESELFFGPFGGPWSPFDPPERLVLLDRSFAGDRLLLVSNEFPLTVRLFDPRNGELVGSPVTGLDLGPWRQSWIVSPDGRFAAIGNITGTPDTTEGAGEVILIDAAAGEELFRVELPTPATALLFAPGAEELMVATAGGPIVTIDLGTGEVAGEATTTATSEIESLGLRPDGLLVAVSAGQIELVDPRLGATRTPITLRNAVETRVRPDGTVLALDNTGAIAIIDTDQTALVEQALLVDPGAPVKFGAGQATVLESLGVGQLVDLTTGERTSFELTSPEGERFEAQYVFPEPNGLLAIDQRATVARWVDGEMTERVFIGSRPDVETGSADFAATGALLGYDSRGVYEAYRFDTTPGSLAVAVAAGHGDEEVSAYPSDGGGLHVMDPGGTLRTYDANGALLSEIETGNQWAFAVAGDQQTGRLAFGGIAGAVVVDPATGDVDRIPGAGPTSSIGFVPDGSLLVLVGEDGTVRLWDVERNASAGLVWDGSGGAPVTPPWFDDATDSLWVASSGKLLRAPISPERWIERACEIVGRSFTDDEWERYVPGDDRVQTACD